MLYPPISNFIDGQFVAPETKKTLAVTSPLDGVELSTVPMSSKKELDKAVAAAKAAFPAWSRMPIKERVQVFYRYKFLLEQNLQELARLVHEENGKMMGEAVAEIEKMYRADRVRLLFATIGDRGNP